MVLSTALAQEDIPRYNLGSMQPIKEFSISPGDEQVVKLYFYNIDGNRITHIKLSKENIPEDWGIEIEPKLHITKVNLSGMLVEVEENIYVEPSKNMSEIPQYVPGGIEYISSPVGYIGANVVEIKIKAPDDEEIGKTYDFTIAASAEWLGQTGLVDIKQTRNFDFIVNTIAKEFSEEIIKTSEEATKISVETDEEGAMPSEITEEEAITSEELEIKEGKDMIGSLTGFVTANPQGTLAVFLLLGVVLGVIILFLRKIKRK